MSRLDDLIKEECPNGVQFYTLAELEDNQRIKLGRGNVISKDEIKNNPGDYPVYSSSALNNGIIGFYHKYMFDDERITWSIDGGGKFFYRPASKYSVTNVCGWLTVHDRDINTKYLYYVLSSEWEKKVFDYVHKAHPSVIRKEYRIPIPSLEVQNEIVQILDNFAELTAELTAELSNRKKQYEYYRDLILSFDENEQRERVKWMSLEDVFEFRNGYTPSKANRDFWTNGNIPWFRMEDIRLNGRILEDAIQHITPSAVKGKGLFRKNSIIMATTATIGEHAMLTADSLANQRFTNFSIRKPLEGMINPKFAFYYFFIIDKWCLTNTNISSFPSVEMKRLRKVMFPIPGIKEQERIVKILDSFDKLTTDISEGIPAEIEAREKQYAYYRDRLLAFEEITTNV